jgi:hypothetical protein
MAARRMGIACAARGWHGDAMPSLIDTMKPRLVLGALAALLAALALPDAASAEAPPAKLSLDIYAIPSRPIVAAVDRASAELGALGMTSFRAKGQAVHATLYLTQYPASAAPPQGRHRAAGPGPPADPAGRRWRRAQPHQLAVPARDAQRRCNAWLMR